MTRYYNGRPLDTKNTAMSTTSPAPAVRWLVEKRHLVKGMRVLDFGAGKGRNASWLRDEGIHTYAYDPNHGSNYGGWYDVSLSLPSNEDKFDVFLTSFVLNVVPKHVEDSIINFAGSYDVQQIHITRNKDLIKYVSDTLYTQRSGGHYKPTHMYDWYREYIRGKNPRPSIAEFCEYGVRTSRGFQRDVYLCRKFGIEHQAYGYKIFMSN